MQFCSCFHFIFCFFFGVSFCVNYIDSAIFELHKNFLNFHLSFRWASALKMATTADKPDDDWYSVVQELTEKEQDKRGSRSFQNLRPNFLKDKNDKDKRRSDKSPARKSSMFDQVEDSPKVASGNKTKTLPRNFSAKDFSLENI